MDLSYGRCVLKSVRCLIRLKTGLKLHEEAEKREVERSIHLLQEPEGKSNMLHRFHF